MNPARNRRSSGFSLLELMVTMGLATMLIGVGAGVYVRMGRRTAAMQAIASVNQLVTRAKVASAKYPATIVCDPAEQEIHAYVDVLLQELRFESRATDSGPYVPMGIEGRDCVASGGSHDPTGGHAGGGMRLDGGSVSCGTFASYDVEEGINAEVWVRPSAPPRCEVVSKGRAFLVRLESLGNRPGRVSATILVQDTQSGAQEKITRTVDVPTARLNEWLGIRVSYDRTELRIATNDGYGFVVRDRWKETRKLAVDPEAALVVAAGLQGWVDDVRIGGVRAAEPIRLPAGVELAGDNAPIRFRDGRLDPEVHAGPARLSLKYQGTVSTFEIGPGGTVLAVRESESAPPKPAPEDGALPPKKE